MLFEVMALMIIMLALLLVFKLHDHLTRTVKFVIIVVLLLFAYVALMNLVSYKNYDLTSPNQFIKAMSFHIGGLIDWTTSLWSDTPTTTGKVVETEEEKNTG